jgi:hypothetical protein
VGGEFGRRSGTRIVKRAKRKIPLFRENLVALDARSGALKRAFNVKLDGGVSALALSGSKLYVAGAFRLVNGRRRDALAAVDATTGRTSPTFTPEPGAGSNGRLRALLAGGGRVVVAGEYSGFGTLPRPNFGILPADGEV